jgi:hypothetical protein
MLLEWKAKFNESKSTNLKTGHSAEKQTSSKQTSNIRQMKLKEISRLPLVISQKRKRFTGECGRKVCQRERAREWERGNLKMETKESGRRRDLVTCK